MFKQDAAFTVQTNVSCGEKEGQLQTLQAEASNLPSGLDATQNISYPWPYLYSRKGKKLHVNEIGTLMSTTLSTGHFRVPPDLGFKTRVGAQPLIWKSFFILVQIKLIFTRKVVHLALF